MTVFQALLIAERAHRGQLRKYSTDPYIVHPIRVADAAARAGFGPNVQAAALLHDVVEDTPVTLDALAGEGVWSETLDVVKLLTKWWSDHDTNIEAAKVQYYKGIMSDFDATALKILDRADNVTEMTRMLDADGVKDSQRRWVARYIEKTEREIVPLVNLLSTITMPVLTKYTHPVIEAFWTAVRAAHERLAS